MLFKNIDKFKRLCNETILLVTQLANHVIGTKVMLKTIFIFKKCPYLCLNFHNHLNGDNFLSSFHMS